MTTAHGPAGHGEQDHAADPAHHADAHVAGHDDHHDGGSLGPIDWRMWGVGVLGVVAAIVIVAAFVVATGFSFLPAVVG